MPRLRPIAFDWNFVDIECNFHRWRGLFGLMLLRFRLHFPGKCPGRVAAADNDRSRAGQARAAFELER